MTQCFRLGRWVSFNRDFSAYMEFIDGRLCMEDPLIGELVTNPPLKRAGRPKCPICKKNGHMCPVRFG